MAHPKHQAVRRRYAYRCGYCGVSETDTGAELTVDHYRPVAAGGDDSDDNLVYACFRCNVFKGDFFPDADDLPQGRRVLHPQRDVVAEHLRENDQTGQLEALTTTGRFHIALLQLNRTALVQHRLRGHLTRRIREQFAVTQEEAAHLREEIATQEVVIRLLRQLVERRPE